MNELIKYAIMGIFTGFCSAIGWGIYDSYVKPYIEHKRITKYLKDKFIELKIKEKN